MGIVTFRRVFTIHPSQMGKKSEETVQTFQSWVADSNGRRTDRITKRHWIQLEPPRPKSSKFGKRWKHYYYLERFLFGSYESLTLFTLSKTTKTYSRSDDYLLLIFDSTLLL